MTMPRPKKKPTTSKPAGKKGPPSRGAVSKGPTSKSPATKRPVSKGPASKGPASKGPSSKGRSFKATETKPAKPVNPFGEKKQSAGKKWGSGSKAFKARQADEELEIKLSDRDAALVNNIKAKLQQIREYKAILAEDGLKPDEADKAKESALIQRLLKMEKAAKIEARQRAKLEKTELFRENAEKEMFAREKKKGRANRFAGEESGEKSDGDDDSDYSDYDQDDDQDDNSED
jgi:hypothetical protein